MTVQVWSGGRSAGAGVVWRRGGLVVTNAHVATRPRSEVVLPEGRSVQARLISRDPRRDLALLSTPADELDPALHADIRLAPGNSGGPLADASARVVGVNAMIVGGLGIAVPSHVVEAFVREMDDGRPGRARAA